MYCIADMSLSPDSDFYTIRIELHGFIEPPANPVLEIRKKTIKCIETTERLLKKGDLPINTRLKFVHGKGTGFIRSLVQGVCKESGFPWITPPYNTGVTFVEFN